MKRFLIFSLFSCSLLLAQNPSVVGSFPREGTKDIIRNAFISVVLSLPNGGLDPRTVNDTTILLYPEGYPEARVRAFVTFKNDLRNITLEPYFLLQPNAAYVFEITEQVKDLEGAAMEPYRFTFTTGTVAFQKRITMNRNKAFGESLEDEEEIQEEEIAGAAGEFLTPAEKAARERRKHLPAIARGNFQPATYTQPPQLAPNRHFPPFYAGPLVATVTMDDLMKMPDPYPEPPELAGLTSPPPTPRLSASSASAPGTVAPLETDPELEARLAEPAIREKKEYNISFLRPNLSMFAYENELSPLYLPVPVLVASLPLPLSLEALAAIPDPYPDELLDLEDLPAAEDLPSDEDLAGASETVTEVMAGKETKGIIKFPQGTIYKNQKLDIEFTFEEREYVSFVLRTYNGEKMLTESGFVNPGTQVRAVPMAGVPPGTYYAVVETANQKVTRKIVILQ